MEIVCELHMFLHMDVVEQSFKLAQFLDDSSVERLSWATIVYRRFSANREDLPVTVHLCSRNKVQDKYNTTAV